MRAYSGDLRERIVQGRQEGVSARELAKRFKVGERTVFRYWQRYQEGGEVSARRQGGYRRSRLEGHEETVCRWLRQEPGLTLAELRERCQAQLKVTLSAGALWYRLEKMGLSFKKNDLRRRARAARH